MQINMWSRKLCICIALGVIQHSMIVITTRVSYNGFMAYQFPPEQIVPAVKSLGPEIIESIDFWSPTIVIVPPKVHEIFLQRLNTAKVKYELFSDDIDKAFEELTKPAASRRIGVPPPFDRYLQLDEIHEYLNSLANDYQDICRVTTIGQSHENRDLKVLTIFPANESNPDKPVIVLDGGIHAREWISPSTVVFIISQIVEADQESRAMLSKMEWNIIPVLNPDGYEYSRTTDRLWRKNRSPNLDSECIGTDLNRNFDFQWGGNLTVTDPCRGNYGGNAANSELEVTAWTNFMLGMQQRVKFYLTYHSYSGGIYYPWAYTEDDVDDLDELEEMAVAAGNVSTNEYHVGPIWVIPPMIMSGGTAVDWVHSVLNVKWSFLFEIIRVGDTKFEPPPENITTIGQDSYNILKIFAKKVQETYVPDF